MREEQTAARERCWFGVGLREEASPVGTGSCPVVSIWSRAQATLTRAARESASQFQKTKHFIRLVFILVRTRDHVILMQHLIYHTLIFFQ